jgi:hypothetical protein
MCQLLLDWQKASCISGRLDVVAAASCGFVATNEATGQKILARVPNECQYS